MSLSSLHIKGLGTALKTLTAIPWPWKESEDLSTSLSWFPVIGLLLGLILYGTSLIWILLPFKQWPAGAGLVMVGLGIWLTRGLHYDGLADWADSIGGFLQREKRLAIMKDVSLGSFGVLALILALSAKWIAFERILSSGSTIWILAIFILSRNMMVELICTLPYARTEEGMGGPFVKGAAPEHRLISHLISIIFCLPFGPLALGLFAAAWLQTWLFGLRIKSRFNGITGDLLGTANEMVEVTLLMICALPGESILCYTGWTWIF
jgi:adenosylcobinamide-GDP ribazoletransferase